MPRPLVLCPLGAGGAVLGHHLFADGVDQQATEHAWQDWLTKLFA